MQAVKQRLQKLLSVRGLASRRGAEKIILAGRVAVDGVTAGLGSSADPETQTITVDGKPLPEEEKNIVIALYKPEGYITTMDDEQGRASVAELVRDVGCRVFPVGRLDLNSSGLLLFTNDGDLAQRLMHPSHGIEKKYRVVVAGDAAPKLEKLRSSILIDGRMTQPAKVRLIKSLAGDGKAETRTLLEFILKEGRNRQIRRLCANADLDVLGLRRVAIGEITLDGLTPGKWRRLRDDEVAWLREHCPARV